MIVAVFRNRLRPEAVDSYKAMAQQLSELARTIPGYISHKGFTAEDGERLTYVEFESEEALRLWSAHPEHIKGKVAGRKSFFSEYRYAVCNVIREGSSNP